MSEFYFRVLMIRSYFPLPEIQNTKVEAEDY